MPRRLASTAKAERMLGFRATVPLEQGLARSREMVARRTRLDSPCRSARGGRLVIPIAMPLLDEEEADAAREAVLSGWVSQGPQVAAFEREFAASGRRAACLCRLQLHDRLAPRSARRWVSGPATR